jgi:2',3'-cyclic-nucleotide 2'-phosphodiesterase (5'-nucleotidase family)
MGVKSVGILDLDLFHTNDIHGRLEAMARLRTQVRLRTSELEAEGHTVLFWDAGDALDRRYRACSLSKGAALAPVLNAMGYQLMTMGNDIFLTFGPDAMADLVGRLSFPVLAANCRDQDGPLPAGLKESVVVEIPGGLHLGVIGLTAPWNGAYEVFGFRFPDAIETARRLVTELKVQGAAPILILSHLGLADDLRLAEDVPGIRAILGAHSHDVLPNGLIHKGVLIAQAGDFAERVGCVHFEIETSTGEVRSARAEVTRVSELEPDSDVTAAIEHADREAEMLAARPVTHLSAPLQLDHEAESDLGNVFADALRTRMGAEVSIVSGANFQKGLPAGPVTFGDVAEVSTSTANPQRTQLRGSQILAALERGLDPHWRGRRLTGFRGPPNGWPMVSGMEVVYDPDRPDGQRILEVVVSGSPLDPQAVYGVAHTDGETFAGTGLLELEPGQGSETEAPTIVREVLEDYLRARRHLVAPPRDRWRVRKGLDGVRS